MRLAVPTKGSEGIHGGDADRATDSIPVLHLIQEIRSWAAAHLARERHGMR